MNVFKTLPGIMIGWIGLSLMLMVGCEKPASLSATKAAPTKSGHGHDHSHDEGPHGGVLAEWGNEEYHAEFTVDHGKKLVVVYLLDEHAAKAANVPVSEIKNVTLTITNVKPPLTLELQHDPALSNAKGIAFTATHDQFGKEMDFAGNVGGTVKGKVYSGDFKETDAGHDKKPHSSHLEDHPGGIHVAIAQGRYFAEAMFHQGGTMHLFLFGKEIHRVLEAEEQTITAYVRVVGTKTFSTFTLKADPMPGDTEGYTSRFVGEVPKEMWDQPLEISIPSITLAGKRYHFAFQTIESPHGGSGHGNDAATAMPTSTVEGESERQLYLTPGGLYTQADIEANGRMTASEKFKNFNSAHDMNPKPGDKICPITFTKANPRCAWIINGQSYEFCCPPCVEEFVKLAKEEPKAVKPPGEYVKK